MTNLNEMPGSTENSVSAEKNRILDELKLLVQKKLEEGQYYFSTGALDQIVEFLVKGEVPSVINVDTTMSSSEMMALLNEPEIGDKVEEVRKLEKYFEIFDQP